METPEKLNPIISELSRIDHLAAEEIEKAEKAKASLLAEFNAKKDAFENELREESENRLNVLRAKLDAETKEKVASIKADYEKRAKDMDAAYDRCASEWADDIFNAVIGG